MKHLRYLLMALAAITMVACHHDDGETIMELHTERFGGQKLAVQDSTAAWCEGDSVWINGGTYRITIDNNGRANVYVPTAASYNAVFPASIKLGGNRVCLPAEYEYATDDSGRQIINLPMAASSDGSNGLFFKHLTGAIIVKFINNRSETVVLDRITVHSANPLCGTFDIGDENILTPAGTTDTTVTIYFTKHEVLMAHSDTIAVLVPVAPTGGDNRFSVEVSCHVDGNRYTARNRQATPHAFQRNMLGYAYMTVEASAAASYLFEFTGQDLLIKTAQDFVLMQQAINNRWSNSGYRYSNMSYMIDTNIDMSGYEIEPITSFTGQRFNGGGHIVSNLTIKSNTGNCALFDTIKTYTRTIGNITLQNVILNCNGNTITLNISPFISRISGDHTIDSCNTTIANININGRVSGNITFGGIIAVSANKQRLTNCSFSGNGTIRCNNRLMWGGLIGALAQENNNYTISAYSCVVGNCEFNLISSNGIYAGGIIADGMTSKDTINNCTCTINLNTNNTSAYIRAGGLVGNLSTATGSLIVNNVTIAGRIDVVGTSSTNIGTIYGKGRSHTVNTYQINSYNVDNFTIPDKEHHNPSGYPTT